MSEQQLLLVAAAVAQHNALTTTDRGFNPLPLFHVNAEVVGLLATLVSGATLVLDERFHRTDFWQLLAGRRITWLNAVPAILAVLAHAGPIDVPDGLRFIRAASAPLPEAVRSAYRSIPTVVSWGMTEAASQITATPLDGPSPIGSVGRPVGAEVAVRSETGRVVTVGEVGSLWIRGPGIVRSYLHGENSERFDADGWLSTGDLGFVDAEGFVFLVGRADDVINRGGEKVYPQEIEDVLLGDTRVREAVVVGRPDRILGQVPVAYIVAAADGLVGEAARLLEGELLERTAIALPRFKRPVEVSVVPDVPRAPTGKVQRARIRDIAAGGVAAS